MTSAANNQAYGNPNWTSSGGRYGPWANFGGNQGGHPPWGMMPPWMPPYAAKPLLIAAMILGFVFWWPVGLALLGVLLWNKRMICGYRRQGGWQTGGNAPWSGWRSWSGGGAPPSSGNSAFDEYRAETLRRLEEEQKEFAEFLNRLRVAKDKVEFDQFMNERRERPEPPPAAPTQG